ncbi:MAG: hypothetical protein M9927_15460 [Anaerolineae bacterium]|nr:hypothetical protein [Anaerolineae bacterium]
MQTKTIDSTPIYRDPTQPVEARVADLLGRMTLEEKLAQLGSAWIYELSEPERSQPPNATWHRPDHAHRRREQPETKRKRRRR